MIPLTRLDGKEFYLNSDHILSLERTPDTVITLNSGAHLLVREPVDVVVARVVGYRRMIQHGPQVITSNTEEG